MPLVEFRKALVAVKAHAAARKAQDYVLERVRIIPGPDVLLVVASDGFSIGCARVPVEECTMWVLDPVDVHPDDVAKILAVFKLPSDRDLWPSCVVRLEYDEAAGEVTVVDRAGGMIDGQALSLAVVGGGEKFPDLPELAARAVSRTRQVAVNAHGGFTSSAWAKVAVAAKTFGAPVFVGRAGESTSDYDVATVGDSCVVLLAPSCKDAELALEVAQERCDEWLRLLPAMFTRQALVDVGDES